MMHCPVCGKPYLLFRNDSSSTITLNMSSNPAYCQCTNPVEVPRGMTYPDDFPVLSGTGLLTKAEIDQMIQWMQEEQGRQRNRPPLIFVSLETYWMIKSARLYGVNHLPRRKIRKCFLRKRQSRINQGKRHLLRCQKQMAHREAEKFTL